MCSVFPLNDLAARDQHWGTIITWYCYASDCVILRAPEPRIRWRPQRQRTFRPFCFLHAPKLQAGHPSSSLILLLMRAVGTTSTSPTIIPGAGTNVSRRAGSDLSGFRPKLIFPFGVVTLLFSERQPGYAQGGQMAAPKRPFNLTMRLYTPCPTR
jgi:hypothetical protein